MKRTAATVVMLAGLGGCATPDGGTNAAPAPKPFGQVSRAREVPGLVGPDGAPVAVTAAAQMPTGKDAKVVRADLRGKGDGEVKPASGWTRIRGGGTCSSCGGAGCSACSGGSGGYPGASPYGPMSAGPVATLHGRQGILPAPGMGPAGAVAAIGAIGAPGSGMYSPYYMNGRTSIKFANPAGMKVTWQGPGGSFVEPAPFEAPARYNFAQGGIYRLRLSGIPGRPGKVYFPTLEVYPATPKTVTYLSHSSVPLTFTAEDFEQVNAGNVVIKVIYLPDPAFQDLAAAAGADELVSTRLEPGVDPVAEANRRGTILSVIRIGDIDLQDPNTPAMDAPGGMMGGPGMMGAPMAAPPRMTTPPPAMPGGAPPAKAPATTSGTRQVSIPTVTLPGGK